MKRIFDDDFSSDEGVWSIVVYIESNVYLKLVDGKYTGQQSEVLHQDSTVQTHAIEFALPIADMPAFKEHMMYPEKHAVQERLEWHVYDIDEFMLAKYAD